MKYENIKTRKDLMKLYELIDKLREEIAINRIFDIKTGNLELNLKEKHYNL